MTDIKEIIEDTKAFDCVECGKCTSLCRWRRSTQLRAALDSRQGTRGNGRGDQIGQRHLVVLTCEVCNDMCPTRWDFSGFIQRMRVKATDSGNSRPVRWQAPFCDRAVDRAGQRSRTAWYG